MPIGRGRRGGGNGGGEFLPTLRGSVLQGLGTPGLNRKDSSGLRTNAPSFGVSIGSLGLVYLHGENLLFNKKLQGEEYFLRYGEHLEGDLLLFGEHLLLFGEQDRDRERDLDLELLLLLRGEHLDFR
jgi:hypothetical protein